MELAKEDWARRAQTLRIDARMWIDGERRDAASGATLDKTSPIDGRHLARVARGAQPDIDRAVASARAAECSSAPCPVST